MTQLTRSIATLQIEDQIDVVGQKFRGQQIIRGAILFLAFGFVSAILAALLAHAAGQSHWTPVILAIWLAWMLGTAWQWVARPLLIRPKAMEVARFIESRIEGLHNGLTNVLLLSSRDDIANSPWLPQIYEEIARGTTHKRLGQAVRMRDLRPIAQRLLFVVLPVMALAALIPGQLAHGWQQLFHPKTFIPKTGSAQILDVEPKDVTLIAGQPLEITIRATAPNHPEARLFFEQLSGAAGAASALPPEVALPFAEAPGANGELQYSYRVDRLDVPVRYRVEVGGTQSPWYTVTLVKQVKLASLDLKITPPPYTGLPSQTLSLLPEDIVKRPVTAAQGSRIELAVNVDVPVSGAMLQCADAAPVPMDQEAGHQRFASWITLANETPVAVLITDGAKQIIARLPEDLMVIHCAKDAPPSITMKWPTQDVTIAPDEAVKVSALLRDDYGVVSARVLMSSAVMGSVAQTPPAGDSATEPEKSQPRPALPQVAQQNGEPAEQPLTVIHESTFEPGAGVKQPQTFEFEVPLPKEQRVTGNSVRVQVEATDNRMLGSGSMADSGPQTAHSAIFQIKFEDPAAIAKEMKEKADRLREALTALLKQQEALHEKTMPLRLQEQAQFDAAKSQLTDVAAWQSDFRTALQSTADTFPFTPDDRIVQKTLLMLAVDPAKDAVDLASSLRSEAVGSARLRIQTDLETRQRRIITTLQSLLALLSAAPEPTTEPSRHPHEDLLSQADQFKKLDDALKQFMEQQQKILDQTAGLAKKPVDNWDDNDRKKLDDLKMAQEKLDEFMQQKVSDFSKNSDQDMSNSSLLKDLSQIYSETTMAKDALNQKAAEIAVADEDNGLELAKELSSNIEKWLSNAPDRQQWTQEDPGSKTDTPMPELPKDLQDMVGELLEQEEDLFDQVEDANANWADSADKGIGMDAADGPIADMSAKGVTGNALPNNNEMNGRSGEGRQGKSQGEFVGDTAEGKGGRRTPTRLDPTPFEKGQIKSPSKDPGGGATGGGKLSGEGGEGLEGPVPPQIKQTMQRLAEKQAELRNTAERLNLQYHLDRYDNFKLAESVALMRRVESDLESNRYSNALRHRDVTLDDIDTSRLLLGGEVHVQQDTTPKTSQKLRSDLNDAMKGELPPAWSDALKAYYQKLGEE
jgi:hypothetical protein